jgi:hypothetical protein
MKPLNAADTPDPTAPPPLALRPREAARELGISERLLWEWTRTEGVPHIRIGNVVLYPVDGLKRWLDDRSIKAVSGSDVSA